MERLRSAIHATRRAISNPISWVLALTLCSPVAAQTPPEPVIYLDQAWSQADRETYYQISQGSAVMSYDIFLNLEAAGSQELFRSDANSDRYGLITQPANPRTNPDGLADRPEQDGGRAKVRGRVRTSA